jgi:hypothetical protein
MPIPFVPELTNLQILTLRKSRCDESGFDDFKILKDAIFPRLHTLRFYFARPKFEYFIRFLERHGKNLRELFIVSSNLDSFNLAIAVFCPNLISLSTGFRNDEAETFK